MKKLALPLFSLCVCIFALWTPGFDSVLWAETAPTASGLTSEAKPFLFGGVQTRESDHQRWMAALHQSGMNTVQVTAYAHQGPWNSGRLVFRHEPAVLKEIRAARENGLQVVLILRVALDHNYSENRFIWHGLTYPETEAETEQWFESYSRFVLEWSRIAEREGVDVLGVASEMSSLTATIPVTEPPHLPTYYLDDEAQERLRLLVQRSKDLFTEEALLDMGAGDFTSLDEFLSRRNAAERVWARSYLFEGSEQPLSLINERRKVLEGHWLELIRKVRETYSGRLTLAANFDSYHEVSFWDQLDYIGINAYFPLRSKLTDTSDTDALESAWRRVLKDVDAFRQGRELDQEVIFTELGYTRYQGLTVAPWSSRGFIPLWNTTGELEKDRAFVWSSQDLDPAERARALAALHRVWDDGDTSLAGILYWKLSTRLDLERHEPFLLHVGLDSSDPALPALTRFADAIRPLSPRKTGQDLFLKGLDAVVRNDLEALKQLGPGMLDAPRRGEAPLLHQATRLGRSDMVRVLLDFGASIRERDGNGFLPLHWTCYQSDASLVSELMPPRLVSMRDERDETPLMKCARLDNEGVAQELLRLRPRQIRARNEDGHSALALAADQASSSLVEVLLEAGEEVDRGDDLGLNPLHSAARRGTPEVVEVLARYSKGKPDRYDTLPVHFAAWHGWAEVFDLLFEPDKAYERNGYGHTLLHLAAHGGSREILDTLLQGSPDLEVQDNDGTTPLLFAVKSCRPDITELLLDLGTSVEHRDHEGMTALHLAARCRDPQVVRRFLNRDGLDLEILDAKKHTPLHHAAGWGRVDNIRLLLEAGADPMAKNQDGETALDIAQDSGRERAAALLATVR